MNYAGQDIDFWPRASFQTGGQRSFAARYDANGALVHAINIAVPETVAVESVEFGELFVSRHRADGSRIWPEYAGGTLNDTGHWVAAMPDGSVLFATLVYGVVELMGMPVGEANRLQLALAGLGTR